MKRRTRRNLIRAAAYTFVVGGFVAVVSAAGASLEYRWDWGRFFNEWFPLLLRGLALTLQVALASLCVALPLGIGVGLCRVARDPGARAFAFVYVEAIRGTPLLVQMTLWYFVIGEVFGLESFGAAVAGLSCFTASYIAEIVRAGIQSVDRGQVEAARSLGLTHAQTLRTIVLPQALRRVLPPLASEFIALVKDSSLASVIAVEELSKRAFDVQGRSFLTFEVWIVAAGMYLSVNVMLSLGVRWLERRLGVAHEELRVR